MPRIFLSYRRDDSAGHAGRLHDHLKRNFGDDAFLDVYSIDAGIDFHERIRTVLGSCDVLLVVIGQRWLQSRLTDPDDLLRDEIKVALERNIRVIPVLVDDARFPTDGLPDDLTPLGRRQAMELRNSHWDADVQKLIEVLKRIPRADSLPSDSDPGPVPALAEKGPKARHFLWVAAIAAVGLVAVLYAILGQKHKQPDSVTGEATSQPPLATTTNAPLITPTATPITPVTLACMQRWSVATEAGVACDASEVLAGGGCTCPDGTLVSSYPSPEGADGVAAASWQCDGQCPRGLKAVALCCTIPR